MKGGDVLKLLKITRPTLCRWVKEGKLKATKINRTTLDYDEDSVFELVGIKNRYKAVIYTRVSVQSQEAELESQVNTLLQYAASNDLVIDKIYKDISPGPSFNRTEFADLLMDVVQYKVKTVLITDKNRLGRLSFDMWKELFSYFNCKIIVLNGEDRQDEAEEKEIFDDIISLIHCFAKKMNNKKRKNKLMLIQENLEIEQIQ